MPTEPETKTITPIFILSLPRSGSTLLQRIMASHPNIATCSEPWIVLPLVYLLKPSGIIAEYSHHVARIGIKEFIGKIEERGKTSYNHEVGNFIRKLYSQISRKEEVIYFLDKTPRYSLIVDELMNIFPDGRFIFLWRNPLSIITSISDSWAKGQWNISDYSIDLYEGLPKLISAYEKHKKKCISVKYEDLVANPKDICKTIYKYLEVPVENIDTSLNNSAFSMPLGDKRGIETYKKVDSQSITKFTDWVCNPIRKRWCNKYLKWIGEQRLLTMGYSLGTLQESLTEIPFNLKFFTSDVFRIVFGEFRGKIKNIIFGKS